MQISDVTFHSSDVGAMTGPLQQAEPNPLETFREIQNEARSALSAQADNWLHRSAMLAKTAISTMGPVATSLIALTMLPLARASDEEAEAMGLVAVGAGAMVARSYGAAQLMRDNPVMGGVALITATALVCGSVWGLIRSPRSLQLPSSETQFTLGATVMSACQNLIADIPGAEGGAFQAPSVAKLLEIRRSADELVDMMRGEIDSGTQAASLEQVRRCVGGDLKDGKLASLRENLVVAKLLLGEGRGISPPDMEAAREEIAGKIALVDSIKAKLQLGVNQVSDEIDRQRSRPVPRIG